MSTSVGNRAFHAASSVAAYMTRTSADDMIAPSALAVATPRSPSVRSRMSRIHGCTRTARKAGRRAYLAPRTHETMATLWILERRISNDLRERAGVSYEVGSSVTHSPPTSPMSRYWTTASASTSTWSGRTLRRARRTSASGPTARELDESSAAPPQDSRPALSSRPAVYHAASQLVGHRRAAGGNRTTVHASE